MTSTDQKNPRRNHRKEKFLEICLLVLLASEPAHGYRLLEELVQFGYVADEVDAGTLYRTLRNMEENNLVISAWEDSDLGPNRRKYNISETGRQVLQARLAHMRKRIEYMQRVLAYYENTKGILTDNDRC